MYIRQEADDNDMIFQADDGSGSNATYFRLDGSAQKIKFEKETRFQANTRHNDNVIAQFGNGEDLQIYHDGSHSYINDAGTGALKILASQFEINNAANTENIATFTQNGAVNLYYDNSKKFETTTTGVAVTGNATIETTGVTDNLLLTSSDSSASSAPDIVMYRNTAVADSDTLGVVEYKGKNGMVPSSSTPLLYNAIYSRIADASNNQSILTLSANKGNGSGAFTHAVNISAIGTNNSATGALLINPSTDFELPQYNLDVNGTAYVSGTLGIGGATPTTNAIEIDGADGTSYVYFKSTAATTGARVGLNSDDLIIENKQTSGNIIFDAVCYRKNAYFFYRFSRHWTNKPSWLI